MPKYDSSKELICSFCGKPQSMVKRLLAGQGVYICDECVAMCQEILDEEFGKLKEEAQVDFSGPLPTPSEIHEALNEYVIDQDRAKKILAVAVYNHYKRVKGFREDKASEVPEEESLKDVEVQKSNIIMIGPTGSGKSTTLYMILSELSQRAVNISTIEDPVEKNLPKLNQMQVNVTAGLTFEIGLRALLRQDPDIIMLGETRDAETASIAVRAAITGHFVLSTLHTNDAASSVTRLIDMGIESYMLANSLVGIIAQRLVRKICPDCGEWGAPTEEEIRIIGRPLERIKHKVGCKKCNGTGYRGRISIHEILPIDKPVRKLITDNASSEEIKEYARKELGMLTLKESCMELIEEGLTTAEELVKVAYYD